jgi:hypothetical protein
MYSEKYICELCGREVSKITVHHLVPKEEGGKDLDTAMLCLPCHKQIHALYSNKELSVRLYTITKLKNDDKIKKYLKFITKHPGDSHISVKKSRDVRKR